MNTQKLKLYAKLMRLDKPIGIYLLLWPALIALWIAGQGKPDPFIVSIFILGVIVMRSAGCVINDIADKEFDKSVARTKNRPLAAGLLSRKEAFLLFFLLINIAFILVLQLNFLTIAMSFAALLLASIYPFMKRYTHLPQVVLGAAFGWAVPMAFTAITQRVPSQAWVLYLATICWSLVYDTEYAMADIKDDVLIGIKSTAIFFGSLDKLIIGLFQFLTLAFFAMIGANLGFGKFFFGGIFIASLIAFYQQYLIKDRNANQCFKAFLNNNWFGFVLFLGVMLDHYLLF